MARRRTSFVRPAPRSMVWIGTNSIETAVGASSAVLLISLNAAALAIRPFTIVRTRLVLHYQSDQATASEFTRAVYSMQVVTASASTAGIASLPTPITEPNSDYFVYQPLIQNNVIASAIGFTEAVGQGRYWTVDSKAMRKVGQDDDVVGVVESAEALGWRMAAVGRMLVKLH